MNFTVVNAIKNGMFGSLCVVCFSFCVSRCVWKNWRIACCVAKKTVDGRTRNYYNNANASVLRALRDVVM